MTEEQRRGLQQTGQAVSIGQFEQWVGRLWIQLQLAQEAIRQAQLELNQERVSVGQLVKQVGELSKELAVLREENVPAG